MAPKTAMAARGTIKGRKAREGASISWMESWRPNTRVYLLKSCPGLRTLLAFPILRRGGPTALTTTRTIRMGAWFCECEWRWPGEKAGRWLSLQQIRKWCAGVGTGVERVTGCTGTVVPRTGTKVLAKEKWLWWLGVVQKSCHIYRSSSYSVHNNKTQHCLILASETTER